MSFMGARVISLDEVRLRRKLASLERLAENPGTEAEGENAKVRIAEIRARLAGEERTQVRNEPPVWDSQPSSQHWARPAPKRRTADDIRRGFSRTGSGKKKRDVDTGGNFDHEEWPFSWVERHAVDDYIFERAQDGSWFLKWNCPACGAPIILVLSKAMLNRLSHQRGGVKAYIRITLGGSKNLLCNDCWELWESK